MNVFLTGPTQVGKSTSIKRFLDSNDNVKSVGGFVTVCRPLPTTTKIAVDELTSSKANESSNPSMFHPCGLNPTTAINAGLGVFIHPPAFIFSSADKESANTIDNLVGRCGFGGIPEAFETVGLEILSRESTELSNFKEGKGKHHTSQDHTNGQQGSATHHDEGGKLIIMDEIGRMEVASPLFCQKIISLLDGPTPILGVVKAESNFLLDTIRAHPKTCLLQVNLSNRNTILSRIAEHLKI